MAWKISCNQRKKNPLFNDESILSKRSVQNFSKIGALVFWEILSTDFKNTVVRKTRLKQKRRPIGIWMGGNFKSLSLLEFYSDWLESLGNYSRHVVLLYKELLKKPKEVVSCSGFKKSFFYIFQKYNILRVYCKNFRPKYEIFTKPQNIGESAPGFINLIKLINY